MALTPDELRNLLTAAKEASTRDWLMWLIGFWHGLRVSELIALTPKNFQDGHITVQRLKGSLKTRQELVKDADPLLDEATAIARYLRQLRSDQKLFPIGRLQALRLMKRYGTAAGIESVKLTTKALKHSCGRFFAPKIGLEFTRQRLGHVDIRNTQVYGWVTDEETDQAVKRAISG